MLPKETVRLRFRQMTPTDLDSMSALLGDPVVMTYYPAPKSREQAAQWISWNQSSYAEHGHGLWIVETQDGEFLGDCGLTWQDVNGRPDLEVGYHMRTEAQGRGYATEAASACKDFAREVLRVPRLVAIIHPDNGPSRRVAEKLGMVRIEDDYDGAIAVRTVLAVQLGA